MRWQVIQHRKIWPSDLPEGSLEVRPDPSGYSKEMDEPVAQSWRHAGVVVWTILGVLLVLVVLVQILSPLRPFLFVLFLSLILVVLLSPITEVLAQRGVPRPLAAGISAIALIAAGAIIVRLIAPVVRDQFNEISEALPEFLARIEPQVRGALAQVGIDLDIDPSNLPALIEDAQIGDVLVQSLSGVGGVAGSIISWVFLLLLAPIVAFYTTVDLPRIRQGILRLTPARRRSQMDAFLTEASSSFSGFVLGQLVVATFVGITTGLALWIIGVPYAAVIGVIAGITDLIPFIGPYIGGALAVAVALATDGIGLALMALIAVIVVQQVESQLISPLVMSKAVELRPLAVIIAVVVGGVYAGLPGLLIAVPFLTVLRAAFRHATGSAGSTDALALPDGSGRWTQRRPRR
jgi:predicted PurR-regulated permease PerM